MDTDIFSTFDADQENQFQVEGLTPEQIAEQQRQAELPDPTPPDGGPKEGDPKPDDGFIQVKKEDWDRTQQVLNEMRGYMTAKQAAQPEQPQHQAPPVDYEAQRHAQTAQQAQMDQFFDSLAEDITSLDPKRAKAALQKAIAAGAQLGAQAAMQNVAPATQQTADLMVENYITRKSTKDPDAYDKVGERFEARLAGIDPRVIAGYSRAQLNQVLDEMYDAELGRWAREKMTEARTRQQQPTPGRQQPTPYGGGKAAPGATQTRSTGQVPETWKKFALDAGIPEDQITPELFQQVGFGGNE